MVNSTFTLSSAGAYGDLMAPLAILLALAAAQSAPAGPASTGVKVSAQASVRILSGARVTLGERAEGQPYVVSKASVRVEDGSRRPAQLVEFQ